MIGWQEGANQPSKKAFQETPWIFIIGFTPWTIVKKTWI